MGQKEVKLRKVSPEVVDNEIRATLAERAYLNLSPTIPMGAISSKQLQGWREEMSVGSQSPIRMFHLASLDIETARAIRHEGGLEQGADGKNEIKSALSRAKIVLTELSQSKTITLQTRLQAQLMEGSLGLYEAKLTDKSNDWVADKKREVKAKRIELSKKALAAKNKPDPDFIQSLTVASLLTEAGLLTMPSTSRFWNSQVDTSRRAQLYAFSDFDYDGVIQVGNNEATDVVQVEYLIINDDPSELLKILVDGHGKYGKMSLKIAHLQKALSERTTIQLKQLVTEKREERDFQTPDSANVWYSQLSPYHQFEAFLPELRSAIKIMDKAYGEQQLTPAQIYSLASMYTELGVAESATNASRAQGHFRKAEALYNAYINIIKGEKENMITRLAYHQAHIDKAGLSIYKALADQDTDLEEVRKDYSGQLIHIARGLFEDQEKIEDKDSADGKNLQDFMDMTTVLLLLATEEDTTHLPISSSFRQATPEGWSMTTLLLTMKGFNAKYFGRLDMPNEDTNPLYMIPAEHISRDVLIDLRLVLSGDPEEQEVIAARERVEKARQAIKAVVDKYED